MSVDDPLQKEIDRIQRESRLLENVTGLSRMSRDPLADLVKLTNPTGGLLTDAMRNFEAIQAEAIQRGIVNAARALQERTDLFRQLVQPIHDFQTQLAQAAQAAFQPFVQIVQGMEQMRASIRVALEPIERIREAFSAIPPDQFLAFQRAFAGLAEEFRQQWDWDAVERPVFRLFAKLGLTGLESHLTRSELLYVVALSKKEGSKAVKEYIFRKFRKGKYGVLNRMVRSWWRVPYMNKRKKAIRAAISAHKKRQFELAIPTLLPLIDGLAAEIVAGTPHLKVKTIYAKDAVARYNADEAEVWSECVEQVVFGLVYRDYDFRTAKRPPSSVNRHGILHGRIVDYGSELNSYRVILLLDVMVKIAEQKAKKMGP